jgi:L-fuconolactonase
VRIDAHQHFWHYTVREYAWIDDSMSSLRRDFLPADLIAERTSAGFDGSIAVQARQTREETAWLLRLAESEPSIVGVIGWVDLCSPQVSGELAVLRRNRKLLGVRHMVQSEADDRFLLRPEFMRGIKALDEFGLTYDILIYPRHLKIATEFVQHFPDQRFVLDHMAKPPIKAGKLQPWSSDLKALAKFPNVFCKLSGLVTEADWRNWKPEHIHPFLDVAFEAFGADRVMIGSDWPVCTVAASYGQAMALVEEYVSNRSEQIRQAVLGGNAQTFWNLHKRTQGGRATISLSE